MRKFFFLNLLLGLCLTVVAQSPNVNFKMGPVKRFNFKLFFSFTEPLGYGDNVSYGQMVAPARAMGGMGSTKYKLFSLGKDLNTIKYEIVEPEQNGMPTEQEFLLKIKDKFFLFVSFQNEKLKKTILLAREINKKTMLPEGELKPITDVDYSDANRRKKTTFSFEYSPDSTRILIYHGLSDKEGMLLGYGFDVLDENLNVIWNNINPLAITDSKVYAFQQLAISNSGNVFILGKTYDNKKQFKYSTKSQWVWFYDTKKEKAVYTYTLFSLKNKGTDQKDYHLDLPNKFIRTLELACNDDNEAVCAGLYCDKLSLSVKGCCSFILGNQSDAEITPHDQPFEISLITKGMDPVDAKDLNRDFIAGDDFEAYFYHLEKLTFDKAGNFWLAAEQQKTTEKLVKNGNIWETYYEYFYEGVYLVKFRADGNISWQNKLAKYQHSGNLGYGNLGTLYLSFKLQHLNDNLYLVYNEFPKSKRVQNPKKAVAFVATYDKDGKENKQKLFDNKKSKITLAPRYAGFFDEKTMVVFGNHNAKYCFSELTFE